MTSWLDLESIETPKTFATIPPGTYYVIADTSELKETKTGTGEYINVKYKILAGEHEGRTLFHMYNIKNQNPEAVKIGLGNLKLFLQCAGAKEIKLESPLDLIGLRCDAVVKTKTDSYGEKAVISYFKPHKTDGTKTTEVDGDLPF